MQVAFLHFLQLILWDKLSEHKSHKYINVLILKKCINHTLHMYPSHQVEQSQNFWRNINIVDFYSFQKVLLYFLFVSKRQPSENGLGIIVCEDCLVMWYFLSNFFKPFTVMNLLVYSRKRICSIRNQFLLVCRQFENS